MNSRRLLIVLLMLVVPLGIADAQDGFLDTDNDGISDDFDACPDQAGTFENYGCPDGVAPPDSDGDGQPDVADNCPDVAGEPSLGGCPDSDGDGIDDYYDRCVDQAGLTQNGGCPLDVVPDWDGDGVSDAEDLCPYVAGTADMNGCTEGQAGDRDGDSVVDYMDACPDSAGVTDNFGCPAGTVADRDFDGVPDSEDQCLYIYGTPEGNGCVVDDDGDLIPNDEDACPGQVGDGRNNGCPEGVAPPDADGDGVIDIYDRCPNEAGQNGLDCLDSDGDGMSDLDDRCPSEPGDPMLAGCAPILEVTLPANRAVLNTDNVASITNLGQLITSVYQVEVANDGKLVVQSHGISPMTIYDLGTPTLTPVGVLEAQGGTMAMSADGSIIVDTLFDYQLESPTITVWDANTANGLHYIPVPEDDYFGNVAVSPDGSVFATANGGGSPGPMLENYNVRLWDTAAGAEIGVLANDEIITQMAFSPDGTRLVTGGSGGIIVWDVASQQAVATIDSEPSFAGSAIDFSPDGTRLVVGYPGGAVAVWDLNTQTEVFNMQVLDNTRWDTVLAVAFSPDGALVAAGGGAYVDGPQPEGATEEFVVLDAASGAVLHAVADLGSLPTNMAFSPDGTLLILGGYPTVQFWGIAQ